ncbi:unnamed protein product [Cochlearia groenlandica]
MLFNGTNRGAEEFRSSHYHIDPFLERFLSCLCFLFGFFDRSFDVFGLDKCSETEIGKLSGRPFLNKQLFLFDFHPAGGPVEVVVDTCWLIDYYLFSKSRFVPELVPQSEHRDEIFDSRSASEIPLFMNIEYCLMNALVRTIRSEAIFNVKGIHIVSTITRMFDEDSDCMERGESLFYYIEAVGEVGGHLFLLVDVSIDLGKELS